MGVIVLLGAKQKGRAMKNKKFSNDGPGRDDMWVYLSVLAITAFALMVVG